MKSEVSLSLIHICAVFPEGVEQDLLLHIHHFLDTLIGNIHERALALHADDLLDERCGLRLIIQTHDGGLEFLEQLSCRPERAVHILEQEAEMCIRDSF